jgi:hypothetical protein
MPSLTAPQLPRRRTLGALALSPLMLSACASGPQPAEMAAEKPVLDLRRYFNGRVLAHGLFFDRGGKVRRRFTVDIACSWVGDEGTLDEQFVYSDGERQRRVWRIRHLGQGRYSGRADDVVGEAQGQAAGNALRWQYTLRLAVDGREWDVQFDDWMYLMDDEVMLNRATMSKFGLRLGEVQLAFRRVGAA